jgi:hypothetical protein
MPTRNRVLSSETVQQLFGRTSIEWLLKDPSERLDFSPENVIFAYQPTQAAHGIRWLYASSRASLDSFRFALSRLPIELCRRLP